VLEAVQVSVNPKVIQTLRVAAVARDGIQVVAVARVTVRANIERLVGGAGEETIIARVGEGTVSSIGSAESHKYVLERGLDAGTAYKIRSIDIADVDVGRNNGAELQTDQAEADKKIAQARAEERRVMAVALEQEMRARRDRLLQDAERPGRYPDAQHPRRRRGPQRHGQPGPWGAPSRRSSPTVW